MRAELPRTLLEVRDSSQSNDEKTGVEAMPWQMPIPLPLPDPSCLRLPQCSHSNLVPFLRTNLPERTGMAGATNASRWSRLLAARQLFPLGRQLDQSSALDGSSAQNQMAQAAQRHRSPAQPHSCPDLP